MTNFSLIDQLNSPEETDKTPLPPGIKYQQYELSVDGTDRLINIPLRETANFEQEVGRLGLETVTHYQYKKLLSQFRGIRG